MIQDIKGEMMQSVKEMKEWTKNSVCQQIPSRKQGKTMKNTWGRNNLNCSNKNLKWRE